MQPRHQLHQRDDQQQIRPQAPADTLRRETLVDVDKVGHQGATHLAQVAGRRRVHGNGTNSLDEADQKAIQAVRISVS